MRHHVVGLMVSALALVAAPALAQAQNASDRAATADHETKGDVHRPYVQPRTADGQPDLEGFWRYRTVGMPSYNLEGGGNYEHLLLSAGCSQGINDCERSQEELAATVAEHRAAEAETDIIIADPPDHRIPFQPWARVWKDYSVAHHLDGDERFVDPQAKCFPSGIPRMEYQDYAAFSIQQFPGYIVMNYEFEHLSHVIYMDGSPHIDPRIKLWMGDSRGHWEGNTLVVDVTNHNDSTWFDIVGSFHTDALHVVERFTRVSDEQIDYEATIEDPNAFTRPWKIAFPLMRNTTPGYELMEMACIEGVHLNLLIRKPATAAP